MTHPDTAANEDDDTDIAATATDLQDSFKEMSTLMDELSETMTEVADGFATFGEGQSESISAPTRAGASGGFAAADD